MLGSRLSAAAIASLSFMSLSAYADTSATATVTNAEYVSVERAGTTLDIAEGMQLQTGDVITLADNSEILVKNGLVTFGDSSCALTNGVAYTLDLSAGMTAKQVAGADVCTALLKPLPVQTIAEAVASGEAVASTTAAGAGNAPLIVGGVLLAAGGVAAAAGGGGGDSTPTSP